MQAVSGQAGYAKREARDFLLDRLEAGPVKSDDVVEEAKQNGIAVATLRRAKKELKIRSSKTPGRFDGEWVWEVPPQREDAQANP
jgi:hypothetical protein